MGRNIKDSGGNGRYWLFSWCQWRSSNFLSAKNGKLLLIFFFSFTIDIEPAQPVSLFDRINPKRFEINLRLIGSMAIQMRHQQVNDGKHLTALPVNNAINRLFTSLRPFTPRFFFSSPVLFRINPK